jgi:hypothetical protein
MEFVRGIPVDVQMVEDLLAVSAVPSAQIEEIAVAIQAEVGFLREAELRKIIRARVSDKAQASALVRTLQNLPRQQIDLVVEMLRMWREANPQNAERFPTPAFTELQEKLPRLIRDYPAIRRSRKARRLRTILGNPTKSFELICDSRPVFNEARDTVEGLIALTTLKIVYESHDLETQVLEVTMSRKALNELADKVEKALKKLTVLEKSIADWVPGGVIDSE